jgi:hypothetical protein
MEFSEEHTHHSGELRVPSCNSLLTFESVANT